jgi:hypothetical protein
MQHYYYDFEESLKSFQVGAVIGKAEAKYSLGLESDEGLLDDATWRNSYAALTNAGADVVYMMAPHDGIGQAVRVQFLARDLKGCERCAIVVYAGQEKPNGIAGFQKVGELLQKEWGYYEYQTYINAEQTMVAVGIMNLDRTLDTQRAAIDRLHITFLGD